MDEIAEIITATTSTQPTRPEEAVLDREEDVVGVRLVAEAGALFAETRVHHRGDGDSDVGDEQDDGGQQRRAAGDALGVLRLLVEREARVPAPVDEQREQDRLDERTPVAERERVEPRQSIGVGSGAVPAKKCQSAATTKIASARYWIASRTFWMRSPISTPRQLTHVIAAMNTTPVIVTSGTLSASSASSEVRTMPSISAQK